MPRRRIFPHSPWRPGKARNGKIARLPDKLRESINLLLLDGLTYEAIITRLGDGGKHLNYHNLKRWRQGGYQDWLMALQSGDRAQLRQQFLQKLLNQTNPKDLPSKTAAAVAVQYMDFFLDLDSASLAENHEVHPGSYVSLLNTVAKTGNHGLNLARAQKETTQPVAPSAPAPNRTNSDL
jgi:hypothetical protein